TLPAVLAASAFGDEIFSPLSIKAFTLNESKIPLDLAIAHNRLMFPYIFFIGMSALAMGILNTFRIFGVPAFTPVLLNLSIIVMSFFAGFFTEPGFALARSE